MKAIIIAAGKGTRMFPAAKTIPKEMLPIVDKPTIQYLVEECLDSGITDIIIVINKEKEIIKQHFTENPEITKYLQSKNKTKELKELQNIEQKAKITYVYQNEQKGDGHAILCAEELIKDEPVVVLFGDDIWDCKTPPTKQMIKTFELTNSPILSIIEVPKKETNKYGIIAPCNQEKQNSLNENTIKIKSLIEKPQPENAPSNLAITGKYIITPELIKHLKTVQKPHSEEIRLIDGMEKYLEKNEIYGVKIEGERFDTGDKTGYIKAIINFALKTDSTKEGIKKYIEILAEKGYNV